MHLLGNDSNTVNSWELRTDYSGQRVERGARRNRVSVGILSWNRHDALRLALRSVEKQTIFGRCEVIVVDNGSRDGTLEMLRTEFPWVDLHERERNSGLAEGRNILVRLAKAPIVFWMDDDCELEETNCLETLVTELETQPSLGVVFGRILEGDDGFAHLNLPADCPDKSQFEHCTLFPASFSSGGTCVRREQFLRLGGYDPDFFRMNVELAYAYRIFNDNSIIQYCPRATIIHRPHRFGRNFMVITYYSHRNRLLGNWRYMPVRASILISALDMVAGFINNVRQPSRLVGFLLGTIWALIKLPKCVLRERRPMSKGAFSVWGHCRHYVMKSTADLELIPARYGFGQFMWLELGVRVLRKFGWKRQHPYLRHLR